MQSCPLCGTHAGPDEQFCPRCGALLPAAPDPLAMPAPEAASISVAGEFSPDGKAPPATPASQPPLNSHSADSRAENWGPGTWGPGAGRAGAPLPEAASALPPTPGPMGNQPTVVREYSANGAVRPYAPYRPPAAQFSAPYPGYPPMPPGERMPAAPGYPVVPPTPGYAARPGYPLAPYAPGPPYAWYPVAPRRPGETYHKVLSILAIISCSLLLLGGLGTLFILALLAATDNGQDLAVVSLLGMGAIAALAGGGAGLYHAIRALMRRESAPFSLPSYWVLAAATIVLLGAGLALFAANQPTGSLTLVEPLVLLAGIVPAFTFLALALQRLAVTVNWRRAVLAVTSGATLSVGVALALEVVFALLLFLSFNITNLDPSTFNPNDNPGVIVGFLVLLAVVAPLVEETTKQISGFFLLPRIKRPQEAFLIGMASGIGFAIVETSSYIGSGEADWIGIAIQRVGAGLLHGVGAGMAGLGWYYLIKGRGMRRRWLTGFGCLIYAYVQHAVFNGGAVLLVVAVPALRVWHFTIFDLDFDASVVYAFVLYALILTVLVVVTGRLRRAAAEAAPKVSVATLSVASGRAPANTPAGSAVSAPTNGPGGRPASGEAAHGLASRSNPPPASTPQIPGDDAIPSGAASSLESGGDL